MNEPATRKATVRCAFCGALNKIDLDRAGDGPKCGDCARPIRLDRPLQVTDSEFDRLVQETDVPVLVDFYADWCGPCKMMAPTLDGFAHSHVGDVLVLKLNTDANQMTAQRFGIRGIPTVIAFAKGAETGRHVGMADEAVLASLAGI